MLYYDTQILLQHSNILSNGKKNQLPSATKSWKYTKTHLDIFTQSREKWALADFYWGIPYAENPISPKQYVQS